MSSSEMHLQHIFGPEMTNLGKYLEVIEIFDDNGDQDTEQVANPAPVTSETEETDDDGDLERPKEEYPGFAELREEAQSTAELMKALRK